MPRDLLGRRRGLGERRVHAGFLGAARESARSGSHGEREKKMSGGYGGSSPACPGEPPIVITPANALRDSVHRLHRHLLAPARKPDSALLRRKHIERLAPVNKRGLPL